MEKVEKDYVLGTDQEELDRLGLQHFVWRQHVLEAWDKAGIGYGDKVLDVGAGPGFASADLSEIVGKKGKSSCSRAILKLFGAFTYYE